MRAGSSLFVAFIFSLLVRQWMHLRHYSHTKTEKMVYRKQLKRTLNCIRKCNPGTNKYEL